MTRRGRTGLAGALVVATVALTSCVGIGAVDPGEVTAEAQRRGGGVTTALVDDAVAAVAEATGAEPLTVHSITAELAVVTIVVPADRSGGREAWRYGTSGLLGGKGLEGPTVAPEPAEAPFPVEPGDLAIDEAVTTARAAGEAGAWVDSLTVARPGRDADPVTTVVVTAGGVPTTVVIGADGAIVPEGPR